MVAVLVPEFLQIEAFRDLYHELLAVEFQAICEGLDVRLRSLNNRVSFRQVESEVEGLKTEGVRELLRQLSPRRSALRIRLNHQDKRIKFANDLDFLLALSFDLFNHRQFNVGFLSSDRNLVFA